MDPITQFFGDGALTYIGLGFLGGLIYNLKATSDFLKQPTVTWPKGHVLTRVRIIFGYALEVLWRPGAGAILAACFKIHPGLSFFLGFIAVPILNFFKDEGPKLFNEFFRKQLGLDAKGNGNNKTEVEQVKIVSAETLDPGTLKTLEEKSKVVEVEASKNASGENL